MTRSLKSKVQSPKSKGGGPSSEQGQFMKGAGTASSPPLHSVLHESVRSSEGWWRKGDGA
jgi:hypothetical protein